jgi:hypothetical protein
VICDCGFGKRLEKEWMFLYVCKEAACGCYFVLAKRYVMPPLFITLGGAAEKA